MVERHDSFLDAGNSMWTEDAREHNISPKRGGSLEFELGCKCFAIFAILQPLARRSG